jgi:ketosteroid isomerase-like protein
MPVEVDRATAEDFYRACAARDREAILAFFAEDAVWTYRGPPDVLPFCGQHHGKAAVGEVYRRMYDFIDVIAFETPFLVVEDHTSAAMICVRGRLLKSDRIVTARVAHFIRWRANRIVEFHAVLDSLDHVEQVLGHELVPSAA